MKRILCILSTLTAGGAETFLMKLYRTLPPTEYQFDFIVSVEGGCYTEEVLARGGRIFAIPERKRDFVGAVRGIYTTVKENDYDVVLKLAENSLAVVDLIAAKHGGAKTLVLRSCNAPTGESFLVRSVHKLLRPLLNRVATVKLAPSELAARYMFGKASDVTILHNGLSLRQFHFDPVGREKIRAEFGIADRLVVGHVGQFREQKNHRYLLEVYQKIQEKREDAILLLVGAGKMEAQIRTWIQELGLTEKVLFAGQRFDMPQLLSAMDVLVFPSFFEGMPNTVIEAQATGLPCVIADTITREADITGLVDYLPLTQPPEYWAGKALSKVTETRPDTAQALREAGYDIATVAQRFLALLGD